MNRSDIPEEKFFFLLKTPKEIGLEIAHNLKKLRKRRKLSQAELAERSNVSYGSLKRFEQTGKISLESLLKIAVVLGASEPFSDLFMTTEITSIQQIIDGEFD
ncbi:MAG: helix-turn-helix transcriptional regulator [Oscillospiraceae bacterium]|nr:helix-turn-helix transcriptional regulator [Oscillospiraceae bacterium]